MSNEVYSLFKTNWLKGRLEGAIVWATYTYSTKYVQVEHYKITYEVAPGMDGEAERLMKIFGDDPKHPHSQTRDNSGNQTS